MMENDGIEPTRSRSVVQEAAEWVAKHDRGLTAEEQDGFFTWLAADPRHGHAFQERRDVWRQLDRLVEWRPEHSREPNPDLLAVRRHPPLRWAVAVAAMAALLAVAFFGWQAIEHAIKIESRMISAADLPLGYERCALKDGSIVELNRGAKVFINYKADKRYVDLLSGEAHFTVAKDPSRPFVVRARGARFQAVGTSFNVTLGSDQIEVLVTEGVVQVNQQSQQEKADLSSNNNEPLFLGLTVGQRSVVSSGPEAKPLSVDWLSEREIEERLAWRTATLDFVNTPLSKVVEELNSRNSIQLSVGDRELANLRITATLKSDNIDGFVELIELTTNAKARREGSSRIVLYK